MSDADHHEALDLLRSAPVFTGYPEWQAAVRDLLERAGTQAGGEHHCIVRFLDGAQPAHLLAAAVEGTVITGLRWPGQAEEGTYSFPLMRVESIQWTVPMSGTAPMPEPHGDSERLAGEIERGPIFTEYPAVVDLDLAVEVALEQVEKWSHAQDPHGWCHQRPILLTLLQAVLAGSYAAEQGAT